MYSCYCILKSNGESFAVLCYSHFPPHHDYYWNSYVIVLLLRSLSAIQKRRLGLDAVFVLTIVCVCVCVCVFVFVFQTLSVLYGFRESSRWHSLSPGCRSVFSLLCSIFTAKIFGTTSPTATDKNTRKTLEVNW